LLVRAFAKLALQFEGLHEMVSKVRQSSNVETPKEGVAMCSYLRKCVLSLILIGDDIFSAHMMKHCHSSVEVNDSSINLALCLYPQLITLQTYFANWVVFF
jgi:hypothetical protein